MIAMISMESWRLLAPGWSAHFKSNVLISKSVYVRDFLLSFQKEIIEILDKLGDWEQDMERNIYLILNFISILVSEKA